MHTRDAINDRVDDLPAAVWDCEACGEHDSMEIRRSSLNKQFFADDVMLKCSACRQIRTHGIPFDDPEAFREELQARGRRVVDFTEDDAGEQVKAQLDALGYIAKGKSL